ncbi:hypothetical protein NP233_g9734 [Leucocoprinus birnbaumii]|uniref:HPP transmembrane region domain-containing protein n=1 Tax=Leucocoprinus birnbaumii TaxID=56174 RepID=A0AAD5VQE6_9AGAR|nr:hypothetical protein NP233_g9734 [Leucocoprinus birnbaumii]
MTPFAYSFRRSPAGSKECSIVTSSLPLPAWLSRWFGYRSSPPQNPSHIIWLWSFIGAFCGTAVIQAVFEQAQYFVKRKVPTIVASYGASAVLIYGAIEAPLAQPRALFGGHFLGALTGVIITKLFQLLPTEERFDDLSWLAASLSCATAIVIMQITQTVHPPAGATALLPAIDSEIRGIGWYYLPVVLLSSTLAFTVALITNNVQRKYPAFWFTPNKLVSPAEASLVGAGDTKSLSNGTSTSSSLTPEPKPVLVSETSSSV